MVSLPPRPTLALTGRAREFAERDRLIAEFRAAVWAANDRTWFEHQAEWQLATEGWTLMPVAWRKHMAVGGGWFTEVLINEAEKLPNDKPRARFDVNGVPVVKVRRLIVPRAGGPAHVATDLAGYKAGKSYGGAFWLAGFAVIPGKIHLVGADYGTSEPEFDYLAQILLGESGMNMPYLKFLNDRRTGRMLITLKTGCTYEVKSWERSGSLKGKKLLAYYFAEAHQLPGLEVLTTNAQNLREELGFAVFTTTPDTAWVSVLHEQGHGKDPDWHCTCEVDSRCNAYTYDQRQRDRDDPEKDGIMTRERFAISWQGKLGHFVGRVYDVTRGSRVFTVETHPQLWRLTDDGFVLSSAEPVPGRTDGEDDSDAEDD